MLGSYCDRTNQTEPTNICNAGFFCPPKSITSNQTDCPQGIVKMLNRINLKN